jgi:hypothetical protein|tara:strand:- start:5800 stop:6843 length:1044 start_codon:yes stop_codon:yes gene_type:complete
MRKLILGLVFAMVTSVAHADYTMIVPQKPGGGTSVWAEIVAKELEKYLGEDINIKHIPGARDIPGFNAWHNEMRNDDKVIMVSHGGNGVSFLQEEVDYDYRGYESIGLMNLNIIAGKRIGADMSNPSFAAGSGQTPEAYAFTMLTCGPQDTVDSYIGCFKKNVTWVKGMSGSERRLAFKRGELNGTRENPAAYKKHVEPDTNAEIWFHHGILQADGSHADDPNYPGFQFEELYKAKWGVYPSGDFYDAYKLVKSFRDGMQKALWVNQGNPNAKVLQDALTEMSTNESSRAIIEKKVGKYEWKIGSDGNAHRDTLMSFVTVEALENLVYFNTKALGLKSVFKIELGLK